MLSIIKSLGTETVLIACSGTQIIGKVLELYDNFILVERTEGDRKNVNILLGINHISSIEPYSKPNYSRL